MQDLSTKNGRRADICAKVWDAGASTPRKISSARRWSSHERAGFLEISCFKSPWCENRVYSQVLETWFLFPPGKVWCQPFGSHRWPSRDQTQYYINKQLSSRRRGNRFPMSPRRCNSDSGQDLLGKGARFLPDQRAPRKKTDPGRFRSASMPAAVPVAPPRHIEVGRGQRRHDAASHLGGRLRKLRRSFEEGRLAWLTAVQERCDGTLSCLAAFRIWHEWESGREADFHCNVEINNNITCTYDVLLLQR